MRSAESIRMLIHYHLEHARGINTEYQGGGIYYLKGDPIPMQLLIVPKLTDTENYWLQSITRANWEQMEVEKKMCDALKELFSEELKEADNNGRTD